MNEKLSNFAFNKGKNYIELTQNEKGAEGNSIDKTTRHLKSQQKHETKHYTYMKFSGKTFS